MRIFILGTGTWGIALAKELFDNGHQVTCYSKFIDEINKLKESRKQPNLPNLVIPKEINFVNELESSKEADMVLFATPSIYIRSTAESFKPYYQGQLLVSVAKGIEKNTLLTMTEVIEDVLGINNQVVALTGPTHAEEVSVGIPTCIVSACPNMDNAKKVQVAFHSEVFRVYTNNDRRGSELCGAFKNIIALACGISDGLGFGDNTKAALITRGVAELKRLGLAMGCNENTFSGLAGIGDLIVTATSKHSRNNKAGYLIGSGLSVEEAVKEVGMVVEGINCLDAAVQLCNKHNIHMPIVLAVNDIVNNHVDIKKVITGLMIREMKNEY